MLAVFLQAFVVQTHFHAMAPIGAVAGYEQSGKASDGAAHASVAHDQLVCAVCVLASTSSRATLADGVSLVAEHAASHEVASIQIRAPPVAPAHDWQSRAPPIAL
jgi:hypothetical protein